MPFARSIGASPRAEEGRRACQCCISREARQCALRYTNGGRRSFQFRRLSFCTKAFRAAACLYRHQDGTRNSKAQARCGQCAARDTTERSDIGEYKDNRFDCTTRLASQRIEFAQETAYTFLRLGPLACVKQTRDAGLW